MRQTFEILNKLKTILLILSFVAFSSLLNAQSKKQIQIEYAGKLTIDEEKLLSFTVKLVDNSIKDVVFGLEKNPPLGAKIISNTGMFSWTPSSSDGGKTYTFDVVAKKDGISDRQTITIDVRDVVKDLLPISEPEPVTSEPSESETASFVDDSKDPQSYVDRYNNEPNYKKWFDENFQEYDSIYDAVGLEEPLEVPASFVDDSKDPQSYVDRYNNEPNYKKWFDENFPEYDSIYEAVGIEEPKVKESKSGQCGEGTRLIDGACVIFDKIEYGQCGDGTKLVDNVCEIIEKTKSSEKPWWKFW